MKNIILLVIGICIGSFAAAQSFSNDSWSWNKIIITDAHGGWSNWKNEFHIERSTLNLVLTGEKDSLIGQVDSTLIVDLFNSLHKTEHINDDPLIIFGKDSTWLINHASQLWFEYLGERNEKAEIDSLAVHKLRNYSSYKNVVLQLQGSHWTDDYPFVALQIIKNSDTTLYYSTGQYPFMLPWVGSMGGLINSNLSKTIGKILPENLKSNKKRLEGISFNKSLLDKIYSHYLEDEIEFERAKRKYQHGFKRISRHFQIEDAEISMMGSIEWGGLIAANCLELTLKDSVTSKNIQFSTIFGRRIIPRPLGPLIRKKKQLIRQLEANPVYRYCIENDNCLGEIHFVNRKSLSFEAKWNFLSDVKDQHQEKRTYRGKFRKAIFFELSETKERKRSFSRWIFLKNGTIVLWQMQGEFLMNLPNEKPIENGYICKPMSLDELKNMPKL